MAAMERKVRGTTSVLKFCAFPPDQGTIVRRGVFTQVVHAPTGSLGSFRSFRLGFSATLC